MKEGKVRITVAIVFMVQFIRMCVFLLVVEMMFQILKTLHTGTFYVLAQPKCAFYSSAKLYL